MSQALSLSTNDIVPDLRKPWVAIDFETATKKRTSACQVALVRVENGEIVREESSLIKPPADTGRWEFSDIHGITARDVVAARMFQGVWNDFSSILKGASFLVAHNATFDRGVLEACAEYFRMKLPAFTWHCTLKIARQIWRQLPSHKLNVVSQHLGIQLQHHEALSDARACARILLAAQTATISEQIAEPSIAPAQVRIDGELDEFQVDRDTDGPAPKQELVTRRLEPDASTLVDVLMPLSLSMRVTPTGAQIFTCGRCNVPELVHGYSGVKLHQMLSHAFARHTTCEVKLLSTPISAPVATSGGTEASSSAPAVDVGSTENTASESSEPQPEKTSISNKSGQSKSSPPKAVFLPSEQQQAFFDALAQGGNVALRARAGTGKTTTLVEALRGEHVKEQSALFLAFNSQIAAELKNRAPAWVDVCTMNALGKRLMTEKFGPNTVDKRKHIRHIGEILEKMDPLFRGLWPKARQYRLKKIVEAVQQNMHRVSVSLPPAVERIVTTEEVPRDKFVGTPEQLEKKRNEARELYSDMAKRLLQSMWADVTRLTFDEQIWMAFHRGLFVPNHPMIMVDEAQDFNELQIECVKRLAGDSTRVVVVGDPRQAIYGFRGAHARAFDEFVSMLGARVLPLTVTRRCGTEIVNLAARIVPDFAAASGAHSGSVSFVERDALLADAVPGDMVISRTNAPLVRTCLRLMTQGKPAAIVGRDIASSLVAIPDLAPVCASLVELSRKIHERYDLKCKQAEEREEPLDTIEDERACVIAIVTCSESLENACKRVDAIAAASSDDSADDSKIRLMSTHKAKGLEANRVWVLANTYRVPPSVSGAPTSHPRPAKGQATVSRDALNEEENLWYVAITRARDELYLVAAPEEAKSAERTRL